MAKKKSTEKADAKPQGAERRKVQYLESPTMLELYANNVNIDVSNWDVRFRLGIVQNATDEVVTVKDGDSFMSHSHAKAFAEALSRVLAKLDKIEKQAQALANQATTH